MEEFSNLNDTVEEFLTLLSNSSSSDVFGNLSDASNASFMSTTALTPHEVFRDGYPSGYTLTSIIIASIIVTILMIIIVVGNMLVIIAIATEKALKNIQNWFIASLAVADFFLGLVIMPFSLANELMGYWVFGSWWCDIHSAADVLLCTASIMNLCLISLDRYWSITQAVEYLKSRTPVRAAVMIASVWIMSALICIPPLLGWKVKRPEGETLPQCQAETEGGARSVGNPPALSLSGLVQALNLKAAIEYQEGNVEQAREALLDLPPRSEPELDPVTLHNMALTAENMNGSVKLRRLAFLLELGPICPLETFANLLILCCKNEMFDTAADILAEHAQMTYKYLSTFLYDLLDAIITAQSSVEEAEKKLGVLSSSLATKLRTLSSKVQECRMASDQNALRSALREYESVLQEYEPVAMTRAWIYWRENDFISAEREFRTSAEFCSETTTWRLHAAHVLFMRGDKYKEAAAFYEPIVRQSFDDLSEDIGYVLYSALGSFYIPSFIMVFVYIRIYYAAKARARRGLRKQPRKPPNEQETKFSNPRTNIPMPGPSASREQLPASSTQIATIEQQPPQNGTTTNNGAAGGDQQVAGTSANISIPIVTCDFASDVSTSEAGAEMENEMYKDRLRVDAMASQDVRTRCLGSDDVTINNNNNNNNNTNSNGAATATNDANSNPSTCNKKLTTSPNARCRALSVNIDTDAVSEFEPSSSDSGVVSRCAVVKPLKFRLCQPIFGKKQSKANSKEHHNHHHHHHHQHESKKAKNQKVKMAVDQNCEIQPALPKVVKPRDPEKEKRRIARKKEKRATLILGLIMGSFIACWLPFFFLYILTPACRTCEIPDWAFAIAFWLGYMNSALNPAIYTIFNKDFRRAFRRILFK